MMDIESKKNGEEHQLDNANIYVPPSDATKAVLKPPANKIKNMVLILKAPPLITVNGIGFRLYGRSRVVAGDDSYIATYYFTLFFFPLIPLNRYCVVKLGRGQYDFLGSVPLRIMDKIHFVLGLSLIAAAIAYATQH
jgi:hypothetical protein